MLNTRVGVGGATGVVSVCLCAFVGGGVGGRGDSRLCCKFHRVREGGGGGLWCSEPGGVVGGLIRSLFIGPQPQRSVCLSACMMEEIKT